MAVADDDVERFRDRYAVSGASAVLAAELDALGSDYGANGYTTRTQADDIGRELALRPDEVLLDLGAGCGWPGLYLSTVSGCSVISLDPVIEGMHVAEQRAALDGQADRCATVVATAAAIPLRSRSVDAVVHTDVMC